MPEIPIYGIVAMEAYIPKLAVDLTERKSKKLDRKTVKNTVGFNSYLEDDISMGLTATRRILSQHEIGPKQLGLITLVSNKKINKLNEKTIFENLFSGQNSAEIEVHSSENSTKGLLQTLAWGYANKNPLFSILIISKEANSENLESSETGALAILLGPRPVLGLRPSPEKEFW